MLGPFDASDFICMYTPAFPLISQGLPTTLQICCGFGGVAVVTFENTQSPLPVILWYGAEDNNFHMVEYNFAGNQACIISVGDGVDFDVENLVMEYEYEYEREGGT